jgi:DNA-binding transcriptional LysR family regulator
VAETDLNLVRTFLRLYETRSVTRTAEQMSLS